ncbi:MAG: hypothetical protein ACI4HI_17835 [Lachnospiraceae bacterium]
MKKKLCLAMLISLSVCQLTGCEKVDHILENPKIEAALSDTTEQKEAAAPSDGSESSKEASDVMHIKHKISDNLKIDADATGTAITKAPVYEATLKKFDSRKVLAAFSDKKFQQQDDTSWIDEEKKELNIMEDSVTYGGEEASSLQNLIYLTYVGRKNELAKSNKSIDSAKDTIAKICELKNDEELQVASIRKLDADRILKLQNKLVEEGEWEYGSGKLDDVEVTADMIGTDAYMVCFRILKNQIPIGNTADSWAYRQVDTAYCPRNVIYAMVNTDGIQMLEISDLFELTEKETVPLIQVDQATTQVEKKFKDQLDLPPLTFRRIFLKYDFIQNTEGNDYYAGTLQPYWQYNFEADEREEGYEGGTGAVEINAQTGEDYCYE